MATTTLASRTRIAASNRRVVASSVAPVAYGYERSLRPSAARFSLRCKHDPLGGDR